MLAAYFLKPHHHEDPPPGLVLRAYTRLVTWSVRHYLITVLIGLSLFAMSVWSITAAAAGLPAGAGHRALAPRHRAAAGLAACPTPRR